LLGKQENPEEIASMMARAIVDKDEDDITNGVC
jgi:hypothetical protein